MSSLNVDDSRKFGGLTIQSYNSVLLITPQTPPTLSPKTLRTRFTTASGTTSAFRTYAPKIRICAKSSIGTRAMAAGVKQSRITVTPTPAVTERQDAVVVAGAGGEERAGAARGEVLACHGELMSGRSCLVPNCLSYTLARPTPHHILGTAFFISCMSRPLARSQKRPPMSCSAS